MTDDPADAWDEIAGDFEARIGRSATHPITVYFGSGATDRYALTVGDAQRIVTILTALLARVTSDHPRGEKQDAAR